VSKSEQRTLPLIVFSQFCCTSLWFAGNGVMGDLLRVYELELTALGHLTSAVQLGFILGTLIFAFLSVADKFPPSKVFFICAILGAGFNLGLLWEGNGAGSLLLWRFLTGFTLAGIYPVGMKIAADYFQEGLGKSLGYLVGALVLGTAFPHLLKNFTGAGDLPWSLVIIATSVVAALGGLLILLLVPSGPYRKAGTGKDFLVFFRVFRNKKFRAAAFGYFGHMWELYTFWAFVPVILAAYNLLNPQANLDVSLTSFLIIGLGSLACVAGGYLSQRIGTKRTAGGALFLSGVCCLLSPFVFLQGSPQLLTAFLIFWGLVVVADSPLFSTLVAQNAPAENRGTALTIVNSVGFGITIVSLQLVTYLLEFTDPFYVLAVLAVGPGVGLLGLFGGKRTEGRGQRAEGRE
jgi:MFS family permease